MNVFNSEKEEKIYKNSRSYRDSVRLDVEREREMGSGRKRDIYF